MIKQPFKKLTIYVDKREKEGHKLLFPANLEYELEGTLRVMALDIKHERLPEGDYCGDDQIVGFERKAKIGELYTNLRTRDRSRARGAFRRFGEAFATPIVIAHVPYTDFRPQKWICGQHGLDKAIPGHLLWDELTQTLLEFNLSLWLVGSCRMPSQRRRLGELVARTILISKLTREGYLQ